jgi:hypothetical protein
MAGRKSASISTLAPDTAAAAVAVGIRIDRPISRSR